MVNSNDRIRNGIYVIINIIGEYNKMTKHVYKYGTGQEVPEGAQYLYSREENIKEKGIGFNSFSINILVWHYFLVEVVEE